MVRQLDHYVDRYSGHDGYATKSRQVLLVEDSISNKHTGVLYAMLRVCVYPIVTPTGAWIRRYKDTQLRDWDPVIWP